MTRSLSTYCSRFLYLALTLNWILEPSLSWKSIDSVSSFFFLTDCCRDGNIDRTIPNAFFLSDSFASLMNSKRFVLNSSRNTPIVHSNALVWFCWGDNVAYRTKDADLMNSTMTNSSLLLSTNTYPIQDSGRLSLLGRDPQDTILHSPRTQSSSPLSYQDPDDSPSPFMYPRNVMSFHEKSTRTRHFITSLHQFPLSRVSSMLSCTSQRWPIPWISPVDRKFNSKRSFVGSSEDEASTQLVSYNPDRGRVGRTCSSNTDASIVPSSNTTVYEVSVLLRFFLLRSPIVPACVRRLVKWVSE